jgi:ribose 5-phosphate isomerase B
MRIAIGSDHAGFILKTVVVDKLVSSGHQVDDIGTRSTAPVDYPPICATVARHVVEGRAELGIVIGGSGQGEAMAANKVHRARAALCYDEYTARLARKHNDANVLSLGARVVAAERAMDIVDIFIATVFEGGRHSVRIDGLERIEDDEIRRNASDTAMDLG